MESQNCRMAEWEGPSGCLLVQPLIQQGHSEQCTQAHVQMALEVLQPGDFKTSLGSLCQCPVTHAVNKFFLMFRGNLLYSSLCPLPLALAVGTTEDSSTSSAPSLSIFICIDKIHPLLFYRLNSSSSLCISSKERFSSPLVSPVAPQ